jgi:[acyl-carrier-protein] S-malonyltransferase
MMSDALIFPGQGSQAVGMGRSLFDSSSVARRVFEEVDDAIGQPLTRIIFEGPDDLLRLTANAQPALMACSIAALRCLEERAGRTAADLAQAVAGHSLGEYSALVAAGALDLAAAARLLRLRGEAMQAAVPVGDGAMAAILGLDLAVVEEVAAEAGGTDTCDIANDNAPGQVVVSGTRSAVERAIALAKGRGARRSMLLPVSAPFHCRLMARAAERVGTALDSIELVRPTLPVIANVTATPEQDPARLKDLLIQQVTARVRWRESVLAMAGVGVDRTIELGAGRVLSGLTRRIMKEMGALSLGAADEIAALVAAADGAPSAGTAA